MKDTLSLLFPQVQSKVGAEQQPWLQQEDELVVRNQPPDSTTIRSARGGAASLLEHEGAIA